MYGESLHFESLKPVIPGYLDYVKENERFNIRYVQWAYHQIIVWMDLPCLLELCTMFVGVILSLFLLLLLPRCKINIILNRAITNLIFSAVYDQHYIRMVLYVGFFLADVTSVQCQIYRENATA